MRKAAPPNTPPAPRRKSGKWHPEDGEWRFDGINDQAWAAIKARLPPAAPPHIRALIDAHGTRLRELRARRRKRASIAQLSRTIKNLEKTIDAAVLCTDSAGDLTSVPDDLRRIKGRLGHELVIQRHYGGQHDPDRELMYFRILRDFQAGGGDLGDDPNSPVQAPKVAREYLQAVAKAILGEEAPEDSTAQDIVIRYKAASAEAVGFLRFLPEQGSPSAGFAEQAGLDDQPV